MRRYPVVLVGRGYWGSKLERQLRASPRFDLRRVCGSDSDLDEVFSDPAVRAVVEAVPNAARYEVVRSALLHGKHVLCEKPLALTARRAEGLRRLAASRGLRLMTDYTHTFSRLLERAAAVARRGGVGRVRELELVLHRPGRTPGGSAYWLLGSHLLSVVDMFVPLARLRFERRDLAGRGERARDGLLLFRGAGVSGRAEVSLASRGRRTCVVVRGERGAIVYDPDADRPLVVQRAGRRAAWRGDESDNLRLVLERFARVLDGRASSNAERAAAVTRVLERVLSRPGR